MEWIPTDKDLPKDQVDVLVFDGFGIYLAYRDHFLREWFYADDCDECTGGSHGDPSHWMPLPEPPNHPSGQEE